MKLASQRLYRITWRWLLTLAALSTLVNFSHSGVRCLQDKIPICDNELQERSKIRHEKITAFLKTDNVKVKSEQSFWITVISLSENEVIVEVD